MTRKVKDDKREITRERLEDILRIILNTDKHFSEDVRTQAAHLIARNTKSAASEMHTFLAELGRDGKTNPFYQRWFLQLTSFTYVRDK